MKPVTDKNKSIKTIPKGVWESSRIKKRTSQEESSPSTDLQGNGYPSNKSTDYQGKEKS